MREIRITNQPEQSITRLLRYIDFTKSLVDLDREVEQRQEEISGLKVQEMATRKGLLEAKGALKAIKDTLLKEIEEAGEQATQITRDVGHSAADQINLTCRHFTKEINQSLQKIQEAITAKRERS